MTQEEGDAARVDVSVAINNTMGMAGMNAVFQGMMLMGGGPEGEAPPGGG